MQQADDVCVRTEEGGAGSGADGMVVREASVDLPIEASYVSDSDEEDDERQVERV
jgi:hypothetical protein